VASDISEIYNRYREAGFGSYAAPIHSKRLNRDFHLNYGDLLPRNRDAAILDIGCGPGHFLFWLKGLGYENIHGVDLTRSAVEHCHAHGLQNVECISGLQPFLEPRPSSFDLVTMNDVIEHFPRDQVIPTLSLVKSCLRKDGRIIIKTLNMANPGGRYLRYADFTHWLGFTETSLRQVLIAAGFSNASVRAYGIPIHSFKTVLRVSAQWVWNCLLALVLLIDLGTDRPSIKSKLILAVGSA